MAEFIGTAGKDSIVGTAADDVIYGLGGSDTLLGLDGDDVLDGGAGADSLDGGLGDDTYVVDSLLDVIAKDKGGVDTVVSSFSIQLNNNFSIFAANQSAGTIENIELAGAKNLNATGNGLANLIIGNDGNNTLNGGAGADTLVGGLGDDKYIVDSAADLIIEQEGEGTDTLQLAVNFIGSSITLQANIENYVSTTDALVNATGNELDNRMTDGAGGNTLNGAQGNDYIAGRDGDDSLIGGAGNDTLVGGAGIDSFSGGAGNDDFLVDSWKETAISGGAGTDRVRLTADFAGNGYTLGTLGDVEQLLMNASSGDLFGTGNTLDNLIVGNAGANKLTGAAGNDTLNGGAGSDTLNGGAGADVLDGGDGNDVVVYDANDVSASGGAGSDTLQTGNLKGPVDLANAGDQTVGDKAVVTGFENVDASAATASVTLLGDAGANKLVGGEGDDLIDGRAGADVLDGGAGNDQIVYDEADTSASGGIGIDTLTIGVASKVVTVKLDAADQTVGDGVTVTGFEAVDATNNTVGVILYGRNAEGDLLEGGSGTDKLFGLGGNDTLISGLGADELDGGSGDDLVQLSSSTAFATGGTGNDTVVLAVAGSITSIDLSQSNQNEGSGPTLTLFENVDGSASTVALDIEGNSAANVLIGGLGDDEIDGWGGDDSIVGGDGDDDLEGWSGNDTISGDAGDDYVHGGSGDDSLSGGEGNDEIYGGADNDTIDGGDGHDDLYGGSGNDSITGGDGYDDLYGGTGNDTLSGGLLNDDLYGGSGDDSLAGDEGDDAIYGGDGNDTVLGGDGDDYIDGGEGIDDLSGGDGDDFFHVEGQSEFVSGVSGLYETVDGGDGTDILFFGDDNYTLVSDNLGGTDLDGLKSVEIIGFGSGNNSITLDDIQNFEDVPTLTIIDFYQGGSLQVDGSGILDAEHALLIVANEGSDDTLIGGAGADTFAFFGDGLTGADKVDGSGGENEIHLLEGSDATLGYVNNITRVDVIVAEELEGDPLFDIFFPGPIPLATATEIDVDSNFDLSFKGDVLIVDGSALSTDDTLSVDASSSSKVSFEIIGGAGDDTLVGGNDSGQGDTISGGDGDDVIAGGLGGDSLSGGAGSDTFRYSIALEALGDTVDGGDGIDVLDVDHAAVAVPAGSLANIRNVEAIDFKNATSDSIALNNDDLANNGDKGSVLAGIALSAAGINSGIDAIEVPSDFLTNGSSVFGKDLPGSGVDPQNTKYLALLTDAGADTVNGGAVTSGNLLVSHDANGFMSMTGGSGSDVLYLYGQSVAFMAGLSSYAGGAGVDTLVYRENAGALLLGSTFTGVENIFIENDGNDLSGSNTIILFDASYNQPTVTIDATSLGWVTDNLLVDAQANVDSESVIVYAGSGTDSLYGGAANDIIHGGAGNDVIIGGAGTDKLYGEDGDDVFIVNNSSEFPNSPVLPETVDGGEGTDRLLFTDNTDDNYSAGALAGLKSIEQIVFSGTGNDTITLDDAFFTQNGVPNIFIASNPNVGTIKVDASTVTNGAITVYANRGTGLFDTLLGGSGDDTFIFSGPDNATVGTYQSLQLGDVLNGGDGNDTIQLDLSPGDIGPEGIKATLGSNITSIENIVVVSTQAAGADAEIVFDASYTQSLITVTTATPAVLAGNENQLKLDASANSGTEVVFATGGASDDTLTFGAANDSGAGGEGNDLLTGNDGNDSLDGGAGADTVLGGSGGDSLAGGTGADKLTGGLGADTISAGADSDYDQVIYNNQNEGAITGTNVGYDFVMDFVSGTDDIVFGGAITTAFNSGGLGAVTFNESGTINFGGGGTEGAIRTGFADADLTASGFTNLLVGFNANGVTASAGQNGILVAVGTTQSAVYLYTEADGTPNQISASELTLLAVIDEQVGTSDFIFV